jgi:hypothetical protein
MVFEEIMQPDDFGVGADLRVCPGPEDPPIQGRHAGLPLRWLRYFFKDHQRRKLLKHM